MYSIVLLAQQPGIFETLTSVAAQVPALVVLCVVVYVFLSYLKTLDIEKAKRDLQFHENMKERDSVSRDFHKELSETNHEVIQECKLVIKDNTVALTGIKNELNKLESKTLHQRNMGS